jgi:hypothetical protein
MIPHKGESQGIVMGPVHDQFFTVFGAAYVQEHHGGFNLPAGSEHGSLAPWGAVLSTLLVAATTVALKTTTAAMSGMTTLAALN